VQTDVKATGKDMWVDLAIENRSDHVMHGSVSGNGRMVGSTNPRQHHYGTGFSWGGSAADGFNVAAHSTEHIFLGDAIGQPFHLTAAGRLANLRISIFGGRCSYPARPGT